jgi:hypothetical protein
MSRLIYHADPAVSRLALYFQRLIRDKQFAKDELSRLRHGSDKDFAFQVSLPRLYALAVTEDREIAAELNAYLAGRPKTRSRKLAWHQKQLLNLCKWATGQPTARPQC